MEVSNRVSELLPLVPLILIDYGVLLTLVLVVVWLLCSHKGSSSRKSDKVRLKRPKTDMPPPFPNGWIPILGSSELGIEQVKPLDVMGEHLVAFRTADGKAHVTDAYCPHLGANLGVKGRVVGNCIECPFHGWRYDATDGACVHVPYSEKAPSFVRLRTWQTTEYLGLIFVWYHSESTPPSWDLPDVSEISSGAFVQRDRRSHIVRCHTQEIAENGPDVGHFNYLHKPNAVLSTGTFSKHMDEASWWSKLSQHRWQTSWSSKGHLAVVTIRMQMSLLGHWPKLFHTETEALQTGPALVIVKEKTTTGTCILIQSLTPLAPLKVKMMHTIFTPRWMPKLIWWYYFSATISMIERDVDVWNEKIFAKNPPLVKEEKSIAEYRKWYSQFYSETSRTIEDVREKTLEW